MTVTFKYFDLVVKGEIFENLSIRTKDCLWVQYFIYKQKQMISICSGPSKEHNYQIILSVETIPMLGLYLSTSSNDTNRRIYQLKTV